MLIQSKLLREGGTVIEVGGQAIHFTPNERGDHVAEVTDPAIIHRLVREIPEGFCAYGNEKLPAIPRQEALPVEPVAPAARPEPAPVPDGAAPPRMVIANGEAEVDLATLDLFALKSLAGEMGIEIKKGWRAQDLRRAIFTTVQG